MTTTPCGLTIVEAKYLRCPGDFAMEVWTRSGSGVAKVYVEDVMTRAAPGVVGVQLHERVIESSDYWLRWHDLYCDCRLPNV